MDRTPTSWESGAMQHELADDMASGAVPPLPANATRRARRFVRHAAITAGVCLVVFTIWALTGGRFWPVWVWLPLLMLLASHGWILWTAQQPPPWQGRRMTRLLALQLGFSAILFAFFVAIWAVTGLEYFWPVWPLFGLAVAAGIHFAILMLTGPDEAALTERIEELTTTRAGAVDTQAAELRRIERDLHDGAQARLVALGDGPRDGRAEARRPSPRPLASWWARPAAGPSEALVELRDLVARHPPPGARRPGAGGGGARARGADRESACRSRSPPAPGRWLPRGRERRLLRGRRGPRQRGQAYPRHGARGASRRAAATCCVVEVADDGVGGAEPLRHRA